LAGDLASKLADRALIGGTVVAGRSHLPVGFHQGAGVTRLRSERKADKGQVNDAAA